MQVFLSSRKFHVAAAAILLLALALRIACARGDLWMDEITSMTLAGAAHSPLGVFLIAFDNNHYLNTLYLYLVGNDASPLVLRSFSIMLGTITVAVAGLTFAANGRGMALFAMAVFALSFAMVNYGSEARGYAGLILCTVLAIHALDRELREGGQRIKLAAAIGFGFLFHLSMSAATAALGVSALIDRWRQMKSPIAAVRATIIIFLPALYSCILAGSLLVSGIRHFNGYHFGSLSPFSATGFVFGYGSMINVMMGLSEQASPWFGMVAAIGGAVLSCVLGKPGDKRPLIYFAFLIILPAAVFLFHVPNSGIRRYYMCSATVFLLCLIELAGQAWRTGKWRRILVVVLATSFFVAQIYAVTKFIRIGRGQYSEIVQLMTANGPSSFAGDDKEWPARIELNFYAQRKGVSLTYVFEKDSCAMVPDWLALETPLARASQPIQQIWGAPGCTYSFGEPREFKGCGISGARLTLYKRVD